MSRFLKDISRIMMLLAVLAINAHLIIPHDHHLSESVKSQDDSCPISDNNSAPHSGFPVHCHELNDLAAGRISYYNFTNISQITDIISDGFHYETYFIPRIASGPVLNFQEPYPDSYYLASAQLRAPPSFA
jgi:hypothetical protein